MSAGEQATSGFDVMPIGSSSSNASESVFAPRVRNHSTLGLLSECGFDCDAALLCFAGDRDPIHVVGVKPTERAWVVHVPGMNERIGESSRS
jgi:hypothetical protein